MKRYQKLDCFYDYDFIVLGINSHVRAYKLCWIINRKLALNFVITGGHQINKKLFFKRYRSENTNGGSFNLLENRSKNGYMIPSQKGVNYFLVIDKDSWAFEKDELLSKLRAINDILLVFEFKIEKEKNSDRFIIHDEKN